ncbi:uncharacterized protein LOC132199844 [Neocloeon triangulifer]|uniref:uncharacterized protein LOC132199844 n=1 Tax=Neocloeon triangulifer TaxID=2078957 RepID=UPI00286F23F1|nr:uncharacterized protein LOC132199844 [Neocloeon triangulifer]
MSCKSEAEALCEARHPRREPPPPTSRPIVLLLLAATGACLGAAIIAALAAPELMALRAQHNRLRLDFDLLQVRLNAFLQNDEPVTQAALAALTDSQSDQVQSDETDSSSDDFNDEDDYDYGEDDDEDDEEGSARRRRRDVELAPPVRVAASGSRGPMMGHTADGVPIVALSYDEAKQMNRSGHHLRLYDQLASAAPLAPTPDPIKLHHRVSPLWSPPKKHNHEKKKATSATPGPMLERRSRVMQTPEEGESVSLNGPAPPGVVLRVLQGSSGGQQPPQAHELPPPTFIRRPASGLVRSGPGDASNAERRPRRKQRPRSDDAGASNHHPFRVAAHFTANSSMYTLAHPNYRGNGRLRHAGVFTDWSSDSFMDELALDKYFGLKDGILTVKLGGLYYFYSQIYYIEEHDNNGYNVYVNNVVRLQCVTTTHSNTNVVKVNTCYTGGVLHLRTGDTLFLRDIAGMRYSLFEPEKSFFGLFRFANALPRSPLN